MIRLLNLGPAEHEEVAIYTVNQRIPNVRELREQLRCEAIRRYLLYGEKWKEILDKFLPNRGEEWFLHHGWEIDSIDIIDIMDILYFIIR